MKKVHVVENSRSSFSILEKFEKINIVSLASKQISSAGKLFKS